MTVVLNYCYPPFFFGCTCQKIRKLISNDKVQYLDATRLLMLYVLHYDKHSSNDKAGLIDTLKKKGTTEKYINVSLQLWSFGYSCLKKRHFRLAIYNNFMFIQLVQGVLQFAIPKQRSNDLFGSQNPVAFTRKFLKGFKVVYVTYSEIPIVLQFNVISKKLGRRKYLHATRFCSWRHSGRGDERKTQRISISVLKQSSIKRKVKRNGLPYLRISSEVLKTWFCFWLKTSRNNCFHHWRNNLWGIGACPSVEPNNAGCPNCFRWNNCAQY